MSMISLILPCGKQYRITTSKSAAACLNDLVAQLRPKASEPDKVYELTGRIAGDTFVVRRHFKTRLRKQFSPEVQGLVIAQPPGAQPPGALIQVVTAPNPSAASLVNSIVSTLLGVSIGLLMASTLVPNMVPKVYAFLWTAVVPVLAITASALASRVIAERDAQFILSRISNSFDGAWSPDPQGLKMRIHNTAKQQIATGSVACIVFIAISYFTNSMIERCWSAGNFEKVESFCRPAAHIVTTFTGANNIISEECRFQLAEALRTEDPGKFREAESIYETNLEGKDSYLKGKRNILARNYFSLGRVLDQTGRHTEAAKAYLQAIENYEQAPEAGPNSIMLAKVLDRLAMLYLKERDYQKAESLEKRCLSIDTVNGAAAGRSVGEDLNDLALIYDQQEKYEEAKDYYTRAVAFKASHLDPIDYSQATSLHNLAEIEKLCGDAENYTKHSAKAYEIWKRLLRFKASYAVQAKAGTSTSGPAAFAIAYAENGADNGVAVPDPMSCYLRITRATRADYEQPHADARFDGLRPYLGRE